ncbi:hypothetical protein [Altericroceibacterium xinjiangense]|uniref:hypothetical protein n=1 Tax=Altericroceibacterium xinjiangense TaxID=762261 RepID=UPI000F7F61FC|nr:hypothetical protein [Altericroceibacterium xinjiangense]
MNDHSAPSLAEQFAAAHAWWADAGVDCLFHDEPTPWLVDEPPETAVPARPARTAPAPPPPEPKVLVGGDPSGWPQDLAAFRDWWLAEPSLDAGGGHPRVPPRGKAGAELMVIVPEPEAEDTESLLAGSHGQLIAGMLSAMGLAEDEAYLAAALPRHTPMPDWAELAASGMDAVLRHHIGLVSPKRLLVLGGGILPLLGHDPAQPLTGVDQTASESGMILTLAARDPGYLLRRADARATLWRRWLDWTSSPDAAERDEMRVT